MRLLATRARAYFSRVMTDDEWVEAFRATAEAAGIDAQLPASWESRAARATHVARTLAARLDATTDAELRKPVARAYARAFGLAVEAGRRADAGGWLIRHPLDRP
ncbi:hypothetical protein DB32_005784 [Sandaracinus amylolyticus]|uniref:Uncharacterized protein n=2 Tax=Sandaracinus amylolyticus TaxID=927083 RepID=A0A0F6YKW4_9BACT|nr:hypothetical protein DB32_005784 [Sandaracinus amylolyticus]